MKINEDMRMCSFDIENMYTNIPKSYVININNILKTISEIVKTNQKEIMHILKTVMEQNYFKFEQYYKQMEGLAMDAPTSAILAKTYIQHVEHKQIYPSLIKYQIIGYFRHINDIFIIYNQKKTNIDETLTKFNKQQTNIKFTIEKEEGNSINFLDLTIHHKKTKLEFAKYRNHTQTTIIVRNDFCHPHEHKISSIDYLVNRVHIYPIAKAKEKELNIIKVTLHNNEYNINLSTRHPTNTDITKTLIHNTRKPNGHK
jgi:hypothetical protein